MIDDPAAFLNYFRSIQPRTCRDVVALPASAERWEPTVGDGENGWGISKIVHHIAESRVYFESAYTGNWWPYDWNPLNTQ
ncbi:MAG: hypothetical protein VX895_01175 [Chloroflexota bacterium]|nr:hypothetical protein [Chloroflexota bacterium]GIS92997.1 MAG: hypothetical protein CM1200mP22_02340 [Dehalococcoidia bacterium]